VRPWDCARVNWTSHGFERDWFGLVYENPPFDVRVVGAWIAKLAAYGNGIALLHARTETAWFQVCWQRAACILFLADRIFFHKPDGTRHAHNSGAPPVLVAFGDEAALRLHRCGIAGALVTRWHNQSASPPLQCRHPVPRLELVAKG
jgi:hypothetical protein